MPKTALRSLTNFDYSDRELLHILSDVANGDGWASTADLAQVIKITIPGTTKKERDAYAMRCISTRFSWMRRYGWIERDDLQGLWCLTKVGTALMNGSLTKALEKSLDKLSPGDRILVMRSLTGSYRKDRMEAATMLRREWQHGAHRNGRS